MDVCESCLLGKMTKAPFSGKDERASDLLGLIHSDVLGPKAFKQMRSGKIKFSIPPGIHVQGTNLGGKVN